MTNTKNVIEDPINASETSHPDQTSDSELLKEVERVNQEYEQFKEKQEQSSKFVVTQAEEVISTFKDLELLKQKLQDHSMIEELIEGAAEAPHHEGTEVQDEPNEEAKNIIDLIRSSMDTSILT